MRLWHHYDVIISGDFFNRVNKTQGFLASFYSSKKGSALKMIHRKRNNRLRIPKTYLKLILSFLSSSNHVMNLADFFSIWIAFGLKIAEPKSREVYIVWPLSTTGLIDNLLNCGVGGFKDFWNEIMASIWRH